MIKTHLILDMNRKSITPRIIAKQLDSGRSVEITVNCDGVLVTDIFDETRILTSKGESSFYCSSLADEPVVENLTNGKTIWHIPSEVLSSPNITMGELRLLKEGKTVSSMPFEIFVEATVSKSDADVPKNAIDFIERAETAAKEAEGSAAHASAAHFSAEYYAQEALTLKNEVEQKLANGEFKGEKGDTGAQGDKGDIGPQGPQGVSGVYLGSGEMPEGYNVQIDPDGEPIEVYTREETDSLLQNKFSFWQSNTEYKVGDLVLAQIGLDYGPPDELSTFHYIIGMVCIKDHTSPDLPSPNLADDFDKNWEYIDFNAHNAFTAYCDFQGNVIEATYATKEEVGNIETALDSIIAEQEAIIAIQNALIGGDNV